jgi:hypothetical protein
MSRFHTEYNILQFYSVEQWIRLKRWEALRVILKDCSPENRNDDVSQKEKDRQSFVCSAVIACFW